MKNTCTFFLLFLIGLSANAQINHGGAPHDWGNKNAENPDFVRLPAPNLKALHKEDLERDRYKDIPYRFGANISVDFDLNNSGEWTTLENGDRVWRLGIESPGALTLNFKFDSYQLPEGGKVFVYAPERSRLLGSFTSENSSKENSLGVGFVFSDQIIISYHEPAAVAGEGYLHINRVTHGYRNALTRIDGLEKTGEFGQSGECNINVNCPEGLPFNIQKRSVALIIVGGNAHCSGALINTTANDETPYLLTANHCLTSDPDNWVFYFNYETPDCEGLGEIPLQSMAGAEEKASNENSDFGLLLLNNDVPEEYDACYSGWDASDDENLTLSAYGIHHPSGDIKKICFEDDAPYHETLGDFANEVWYIEQWELGVTEGGSSGSPLFNQSGKIIGQLAGGIASCSGSENNGGFDFYGRLGVSWDYGSSASSRLKDWLDPGNTGQLQMTSSCASSIPENDISLGNISEMDEIICSFTDISPSISVVNVGSNEITTLTLSVALNGSPMGEVNWSGTLAPFNSATVDLGIFTPNIGVNELIVEVVTVNATADPIELGNTASKTATVFEESQDISIEIQFDNWPSETSWHLENEDQEVLYSGGGYSDSDNVFETEACLGLGCYAFVINDEYSDGICCEYGEGYYVLLNAQGDTLANGGDFSQVESTDFCISTVSVQNPALETISIYPNPTNGLAHISFGDAAQSVRAVRVSDALGKTIYQKSEGLRKTSTLDLNTAQYEAGIYFITIETDRGGITRRLVVMR